MKFILKMGHEQYAEYWSKGWKLQKKDIKLQKWWRVPEENRENGGKNYLKEKMTKIVYTDQVVLE